MKNKIKVLLAMLAVVLFVSFSTSSPVKAFDYDLPTDSTLPAFKDDTAKEGEDDNVISNGTAAEKSTGDTKKNLEKWGSDLEVNDPLKSIFRGFGWWVIIQGGDIVNGITGASKNTFDLLNIYGTEENPGPLQKTIDDYMPIFVAVGTLVFVLMTLGIVFSKNQEVVTLLKSLLLSASIVVLLPFCFGQFSTLTSQTGKLVATQSNTGYAVINKNVRDLYAIDKNYDWVLPTTETIDETTKKQNFLGSPSKQELQRMDINGVADPSKLSKTGADITKNMLIVNEKGKVTVVSLNDGVGKSWWQSLLTGDASYYRYHVNFFTIIFYELLVLIVSAFLLYKLIKIEFEIVTNAGILQATAMTDTKGKRNWELITKISSGFSAMIMVLFLQVLFSDGYAVTSTLKGGVFVQFVAGIALAFAVIEGPNVFQSLFGVSAGLDTGLKDLMTLSQGSMLAKNMISGGKAVGGGILAGGAYGAGGVAGMVSGAFSQGENTDNLGGGSKGMNSDENDSEVNEESTQNQRSDLNNDEQFKDSQSANMNSDEQFKDNQSSNMNSDEQLNRNQSEEVNNDTPADGSEMNGSNGSFDDSDPNLASMASEMENAESQTESEQGAYQAFNDTPNEHSTGFDGSASHAAQMDDKANERMSQGNGEPNPKNDTTSQNMGQSKIQDTPPSSPARPMTFGTTAKNMAQGYVNNKINSPRPNLIQRYNSAYQSSKALSQGTINSVTNRINKKGENDA
ncbi:hypothetical protein QYH60_13450 (plasmid) [Lactococcus lactis subsp. lactis]|uniref:pLS20_p028 family conjugation system transmembrane protein n=1 Tax=Lactococcus lactis TaxID=1358 RepID=UPI00264763C7|nr:hypothetical protein [Lactococcus lactis]WKB49878.1 hypothetical protein QYH60_13450 [Lactococcus lactis subsp. lactis]